MEAFLKAAEEVKGLNYEPSNDEKLQLYGLYKQATVGDVNTARPGGLLNLKEKAKWDAWSQLREVPSEKAASDYVNLVDKLKARQLNL